MSNTYFKFKQFTVHQEKCAMKVTTDACLFGAWVAEHIKNEELKMSNCLDIGTGTGLLSLMLAQQHDAAIDSIEMDKDAFEQASSNIAASPWHTRIKVLYGDARHFTFPHKYDIILSNPPFYENELKGDDIKKNIAHHSEQLLLAEVVTIIKGNLTTNGVFYLLLPYKRNDEIKKFLVEKEMAIRQMIFVKQSLKHDYFRIILSGSFNTGEETETIIDELSIWEEKQQYTPEFIKLLKDYYLYL